MSFGFETAFVDYTFGSSITTRRMQNEKCSSKSKQTLQVKGLAM